MAIDFHYRYKSRDFRGSKTGISAKMSTRKHKIPPNVVIEFHNMAKYLIANKGMSAEPVLHHIQKKLGYHFDKFISIITRSSSDTCQFRFMYMRKGDNVYYSTVSFVDGIIMLNNRFLCPNDIQKEKISWSASYYRNISFNGNISNSITQNSNQVKHLKKQWQRDCEIKVQLAVEHMVHHDKQQRNHHKKNWNIPDYDTEIIEDDLVITNPHLE